VGLISAKAAFIIGPRFSGLLCATREEQNVTPIKAKANFLIILICNLLDYKK
jgi:hypothetical protein